MTAGPRRTRTGTNKDGGPNFFILDQFKLNLSTNHVTPLFIFGHSKPSHVTTSYSLSSENLFLFCLKHKHKQKINLIYSDACII